MSAAPANSPRTPGHPRSGPGSLLSLTLLGGALLGGALLGCAPLPRPANFVGATDRVTDATLVGPFDGQILDEATGEPIRDAVVVGVWNYDAGDGFIGPAGSETVRVLTDEAGRYRIPPAPRRIRRHQLRLVSFRLVVYRRGYLAYRSDAHIDGEPRTDFTVRHNRIAMRKWREDDSHADHLFFLSAPIDVDLASAWERDLANLELYRRQGGDDSSVVRDPGAIVGEARPGAESGASSPPAGLLDATVLLSPEEVARRTGDEGELIAAELPEDLERTSYYHGVSLQARDRPETYDITYRVWWRPPMGLDAVVDTFGATLPGVRPSDEVTGETYLAESDTVRIVGFVDRTRDAAVLLTCGVDQCQDMATAIILAKFLDVKLGELRLVDADGTPLPPGDDSGPADADDDDDEGPAIPQGAYPPLERPGLGR